MQRWFQLFHLPPHGHRHCKISTAPFFVDKVEDVVGLYLNGSGGRALRRREDTNPGTGANPTDAAWDWTLWKV